MVEDMVEVILHTYIIPGKITKLPVGTPGTRCVPSLLYLCTTTLVLQLDPVSSYGELNIKPCLN